MNRFEDARHDRRQTHTFTSTMVAKAWWDPATLVLEVQFEDGTRWLYERVTDTTWEQFKSASSAGHFVHTHLNGLRNRAK